MTTERRALRHFRKAAYYYGEYHRYRKEECPERAEEAALRAYGHHCLAIEAQNENEWHHSLSEMLIITHAAIEQQVLQCPIILHDATKA